MKKILALTLALFVNCSTGFADDIPNRIPDELYITEHWLSLTTSYDIETKTQKLGTLYRRFFSFLLTYDFYDPFDNKLAYATSKFFSFNVHFDVFDNQDNFLGAADERIFAFFPTFDIYDRDGYTKLATASMNFWGTKFTLYDPITNKEMATMTRSFFRLKNDWTFHVTQRALFDVKGIDPRVLMTVIAFQGDREYWESQDNELHLKSKQAKALADVSPRQLAALKEKVTAVSRQQGLDSKQVTDEHQVASVADEIETQFQNATLATEWANDGEKIAAFVDYCLELLQKDSISQEKKNVVLFLLKSRLAS